MTEDWPGELDMHEAEIERAIEEDRAETAVNPGEAGERACRYWSRKLVLHAQARLHFAIDVRSHLRSREWTAEAADALHAASKLSDPPIDCQLLRLSARLNETLRFIGHPSGEELEAATKEIEAILQEMPKEPEPADVG